MKYTKVTLTEKTLGLVFDRISRMMKSGIVLCDSAWNESNLNPLHQNLDFDYQIKHYKNQVNTTLCKKGAEIFYDRTFIRIESAHSGTSGTIVYFGDTIYFTKDEIRIKSGKPHFILKMHYVKRLRLLARPPYDFNSPVLVAFSKAEANEEENDRHYEQSCRRDREEMFEDSLDEDHLLN